MILPPRFLLELLRKKVRLSKVLPWVAFFLLVLGTGWYAFALSVNRRFQKQVNSLRESGYKASLVELAPPPIPEDENAASFFTEAFSRIGEPQGSLSELGDKPRLPLEQEERTEVERFLERNKEAFDWVRRGRSRPRCRYPRDFSACLSPPAPEIAPSIRLARGLALRAQVEAAAGHHGEARECVRDILTLADAFKEEPLFTTQFVRFSILDIGLFASGACVRAESSDEDLANWLEALPSPALLDGTVEQCARGYMASMIQTLVDPGQLMTYDEAARNDWAARTGMPLVGFLFRRGSMESLEKLRRLVECCRKPYPESRLEVRSINPPSLGCDRPGSLDLVDLFMPAMGRALDRQATVQSALAVARAGIEFEIHRLRDGKYPETVSAIDPCAGKPLIYDPVQGKISSRGRPGATEEEIEEEGLVWKLRRR